MAVLLDLHVTIVLLYVTSSFLSLDLSFAAQSGMWQNLLRDQRKVLSDRKTIE